MTGSDIRRFRKTIGLTQIDFSARMGVSQSALSLLESGQIVVSKDYIELLREQFSGKKFDPTFERYMKDLQRAQQSGREALSPGAGRHLTLTVWEWEEGFDLARTPHRDRAVDLVMVRAMAGAAMAFRMPDSSPYWRKKEILVFAECGVGDLRAEDVCLVQFVPPRGRSTRTVLAIAQMEGSKRSSLTLRPLSPRASQMRPDSDQIRTLMRTCSRTVLV